MSADDARFTECAADCGRPLDVTERHVTVEHRFEVQDPPGHVAEIGFATGASYHVACDPQQGRPAWESAPTADLPATLASVDDVRRVCEAAGLTLGAYGDEWGADGVRVGGSEHVGRLVTIYAHHGLLYGRQPITDIYHGAPSSLLWRAIQAARSTS